MRRRSDLLVAQAFVASVALLALNDAVLKARFPGVVTGKLSDVAGLFAFVVFASVFVPPRIAAFATAIGFAWWKSPLSQPLIDAVPFGFGRVVDYTDLFALAVIPLAMRYVARPRPERRARIAKLAMAALSLVAFVATTIGEPHDCCARSYFVPHSETETIASLTALTDSLVLHSGDLYIFALRARVCYGATAQMRLTAVATGTRMDVLSVTYQCRDGNRDAEAQRAFETEVLTPLGARPYVAPSIRTNER